MYNYIPPTGKYLKKDLPHFDIRFVKKPENSEARTRTRIVRKRLG
jgi:hypothetical protein